MNTSAAPYHRLCPIRTDRSWGLPTDRRSSPSLPRCIDTNFAFFRFFALFIVIVLPAPDSLTHFCVLLCDSTVLFCVHIILIRPLLFLFLFLFWLFYFLHGVLRKHFANRFRLASFTSLTFGRTIRIYNKSTLLPTIQNPVLLYTQHLERPIHAIRSGYCSITPLRIFQAQAFLTLTTLSSPSLSLSLLLYWMMKRFGKDILYPHVLVMDAGGLFFFLFIYLHLLGYDGAGKGRTLGKETARRRNNDPRQPVHIICLTRQIQPKVDSDSELHDPDLSSRTA